MDDTPVTNELIASLSPQAQEVGAEIGAAVEAEVSSEAYDAAKGARVNAAFERLEALPAPDQGFITMLFQME